MLAWGDQVLPQLPPRARATFKEGRFVAADGAGCTFAVATEQMRKLCEPKRAEVEAALSKHFGTELRLRLVVDQSLDAGDEAHEARETAPAAAEPPTVDLEELDGGEISDSTTIAAARVLDAFPGATELEA